MKRLCLYSLAAVLLIVVMDFMTVGGTAPREADSKASMLPAGLSMPVLSVLRRRIAEGQKKPSSLSIAALIRQAKAGSRVVIPSGYYRESHIVIDKALHLVGEGFPIIDGQQGGDILTIRSPNVHVEGLVFASAKQSFVHDWAAVKVKKGKHCSLRRNFFLNNFFAIYLENTEHCLIQNNRLVGRPGRETYTGNGIHLWHCRHIKIQGNHISGHRDGIYFEFVQSSLIRNNYSEGNLRYGLHFMFSHDSSYTHNVFRNNGAGVAVMYTRSIVMQHNLFVHNWGPASYGLLLKDIRDSQITDNCFSRNTIGLYSEGSLRIAIARNQFLANGYAIRLLSNSVQLRFVRNNFIHNSFDVASNYTQESANPFLNNYWSRYDGYDLNRDGKGDVPHHPLRLFSVLVQQQPASLVLLRSPFVQLLDTAERVMPVFTPRTLVDTQPLMHQDEQVARHCRQLSRRDS